MTDLPFLVAGGGIAGLAAALGLSRAGYDVRLFEQAAAFEDVGAGLQMSPNAVRALMALGAWDAVVPHCVAPSEIHVRDGRSGSLLQRVQLGTSFERRFVAPYRVCHRADLLRGLLETARSRTAIELNVNHRVRSADSPPAGAILQLSHGQSVEGRAIIAADGIRSTLRHLVCGAVQPALRGQAIFRALIPISSVPHNIEADCVTIWLCPAGHVVHYPVSNGRNFNIVAAVDAAGEISDWNEPRNASDVLDRFRHAADGLVSVLMRPKFWTGWQAADLPELPRWSKDNLLLLGDAAHASLPYLAQGAAMALEDAAILPALLKTGETAEAFKRFEAIRQPRTARLKAQSRQMTSVYHAAGTLARVRNATLKFGGSGLLLQRLAWLYDWTSE